MVLKGEQMSVRLKQHDVLKPVSNQSKRTKTKRSCVAHYLIKLQLTLLRSLTQLLQGLFDNSSKYC